MGKTRDEELGGRKKGGGGGDAGERRKHSCTIITNRYNSNSSIVLCNKPVHSDNKCASFLITCMQLNHIQRTLLIETCLSTNTLLHITLLHTGWVNLQGTMTYDLVMACIPLLQFH